MNITSIETISGVFIDLADPRPEDINIYDIAWALSRQSRYAGHTNSKYVYSVAQHTVQVSRFVEYALEDGPLRYRFEAHFGQPLPVLHESEKRAYTALGLMHDFAEAYLTDLPNPVKRLPGVYEAYKKFERQMDRTILTKYGPTHVGTVDWNLAEALIDWADIYALQIEAYHMVASRGEGWACNRRVQPETLDVLMFESAVDSLTAFSRLINRFSELKQ